MLYKDSWSDPNGFVVTQKSEFQLISLLFFFFSGWSFQMGSAYQFHSWRVFVLVCAFPCVAAIAALSSMPESPRFYLEVRRCPALAGFTHIAFTIPHKVTDRNKTGGLHKVWRFLFYTQNGKHDEGWMILKQVHDTNMRAKGYPERVFSVSQPTTNISI